MSKVFFFLVISSASFAVIASAQSSNSRPTSTAAKHATNDRTPQKYSSEAFSGTIAPGFAGNNLQSIYDAIDKHINIPKGEFETSADYEKRLEDERAKPLIGRIKIDSLLGFVPEAGYFNVSKRYDADAGKMTVSVSIQRSFEPSAGGFRDSFKSPSITWRKRITGHTYIGSNAFGATARVTQNDDDIYALKFDLGAKWQEKDWSSVDDLQYEFSMSANDARSTKDHLRVLILCHIDRENPVSTGTHNIEATFSAPLGIAETFKYLHVKPEEVWVFDQVTGTVYLRQPGILPD